MLFGGPSPASLHQAVPTSPRSPCPRNISKTSKPPTLFGRLPSGPLAAAIHSAQQMAPQSPGLCPRRPATRELDSGHLRRMLADLPAHHDELDLAGERSRRYPTGSALLTARSSDLRGVEASTVLGLMTARVSRTASCELQHSRISRVTSNDSAFSGRETVVVSRTLSYE